MSEEIELLVVVINYKTPGLVVDCINSMQEQLSEQRRVVIIDNFSNDGSVEALRAWLADAQPPYVEFVESPTNSGFSAGNNLGIRTRKAQYYLLTNSDTLIRPGAIEQLVETAKQHPEAGLIGPRLEWPDATPQISCFRFHSPISELIAAANTAAITRIFHRWFVPVDVKDELAEYEWVSFACVLLRKEVVEQIGLMDEDYFLYYEDVDYSRMAYDAGWKVINNPAARVVHLRGGSSDVKANQIKKSRQPRFVWESRSRYFAKHYGHAGLLLANLLWVMGACLVTVRAWVSSKNSPILQGQWRDIWTNFFAPLKPREK
ncbi:glycosyltransferase family 2 protein [Halioxenophilus sp. WMMB6]|uniref:glycosyltransferase family 2 protein n=1 Tax=Halioxenophilus sp. WMMB6 TaxID=3073815 RepID=UPI00295EFC9B|nr:glycosyltransferase family 2 protein [Halioxenophilus sp. WMMB6]